MVILLSFPRCPGLCEVKAARAPSLDHASHELLSRVVTRPSLAQSAIGVGIACFWMAGNDIETAVRADALGQRDLSQRPNTLITYEKLRHRHPDLSPSNDSCASVDGDGA
jgi:hypothetical protein